MRVLGERENHNVLSMLFEFLHSALDVSWIEEALGNATHSHDWEHVSF